jgi:hypothetical protein
MSRHSGANEDARDGGPLCSFESEAPQGLPTFGSYGCGQRLRSPIAPIDFLSVFGSYSGSEFPIELSRSLA